MTPLFLSKLIPLALVFISGAWGQSGMAQCRAGFDWNRNSLGQDACLIGSTLDAACRGFSEYNYPPLKASQIYLPPRVNYSDDLRCDCNTVMYSLYMECASCQGAKIYPWSKWIAACDGTYYISQYPIYIPQGTAIPRWAFFNVTSLKDQTFDKANAMRIGRDPEELPTGGSSGRPTISLTATVPSPTDNSDASKGGSHVGAIVGGVVGSVVPLTFLAVGVFLFMRYVKLREAERRQEQNPDRPSMYGSPTTSTPLTPYNPSDPSTFPLQSPLVSSPAQTAPVQSTRGAYSGAAEV